MIGPNDGDNSAIVGTVKTGIAPKVADHHTQNDVPVLSVNKLASNEKITIDGKLNEPEWGGAASTGPFVDVGNGKPNPASPVSGSAKILWDDKNLYVYYEVKDADAYVGFTDAKSQPNDFTATGLPKLWTKDTVEMMVDPDPSGDNKDYYELQIGPQNKVFQSQFDTLGPPNGGPHGPFGHEDWDPKLKSAVTLEKGPDGKVTGYTVEAAIPWAAYGRGRQPPAEAGRRVARELLRHEEQRRRRLVADPGAGELPQGVPLRAHHVGGSGRLRAGGLGRACGRRRRTGSGRGGAGRRRRHADDADAPLAADGAPEAEDRDGAVSGDRTGQGSTLARNSARAARMLYD